MTEEWLRELLPECQDWQIECIVKQWHTEAEADEWIKSL